MKTAVALFSFLTIGILATTDAANAAVYCQYIDYPASCSQGPASCLDRASWLLLS